MPICSYMFEYECVFVCACAREGFCVYASVHSCLKLCTCTSSLSTHDDIKVDGCRSARVEVKINYLGRDYIAFEYVQSGPTWWVSYFSLGLL